MTATPITTLDTISHVLQEQESTRYHEAGHAVADYIHGFRPMRVTVTPGDDEAIIGLAEHDRRTTRFLHQGYVIKPQHRAKAEAFAVGVCAGIAAESRSSGVAIDELRHTSGMGDYETLTALANRLAYSSGDYFSVIAARQPEAIAAKVQEWESRAVALMADDQNWAAVQSIVDELDEYDVVEGIQLTDCIRTGLK